MPKILKIIIGYIAFTIILALMIFSSAFSDVDKYKNTYDNNEFIIFIIIFGLIFASNYWIAKKLIQKGYSRLKVRFIFSILVSLASGIAIKIDLMLSGISMNFMDMFLIIFLLGVVVFIGSYGKYGKDLLDFNREKEKIDWEKTWKDILSVSSIALLPLLSISVVIIIVFLLL